ncbi:MAG TPA: CorA family divalent cation transporter [Allosphingosinicella sp.]|jgi:zinc transporter
MECGLLIGDGPFRQLTVPEAEVYRGPGFLWLHLHGRDESDVSVLKRQDHIPDVAAHALLATETRPRCDRVDYGAIINLRGPGELDPDDSDRLVSIRLWVHQNRVTSVSRRRMNATKAVMAHARAGKIQDAGDLVAAYALAISLELDPQVAALGDSLDDIESGLEDIKSLYKYRASITKVRSEAIAFRRFVAPNRDALLTLAAFDFEWLNEDDRLHIREAADKFARMAEELEAVRERAGLLHEQITDLRGEQVEQRSLYIGVLAFIFLPLTFITGLFGMNVEGIPIDKNPWAFWIIAGLCVLVGVIVLVWFAWRHWLRDPS